MRLSENECLTKRKKEKKNKLIGGHVTRLPMDHKFVTENQLSFNTRQDIFLLFHLRNTIVKVNI